jgi:hypothetical protein
MVFIEKLRASKIRNIENSNFISRLSNRLSICRENKNG